MKLDNFMSVDQMTQKLLDISNIIKTYSSINTKQINYATETQLMLLQIYQYYLFFFWPEESFEKHTGLHKDRMWSHSGLWTHSHHPFQ